MSIGFAATTLKVHKIVGLLPFPFRKSGFPAAARRQAREALRFQFQLVDSSLLLAITDQIITVDFSRSLARHRNAHITSSAPSHSSSAEILPKMGDFLQQAYTRIRQSATASEQESPPTLPSTRELAIARAALEDTLAAFSNHPETRRGSEATLDHLLNQIVPALNGQNRSSRYWGFVTGSTLPIAEAADNIVSAYDQNVQVHLPDQTIATEVEDIALKMLLRLLQLGEPCQWGGRTFTTGATASNILGLACGRESVLMNRLPEGSESVGELGLLKACAEAGVEEIQVLTSMGHSSLSKAASVVGLGRSSVKALPYSDEQPWRLDIDAVERELQRKNVASIIAISAGEVNTGRFAVESNADMSRLRNLADRFKAWIHVDGAFGIFVRCLPKSQEFSTLESLTHGLELADSITMDGHKLLNVPYDNGVFVTRTSTLLASVFQNPNAAYLSGGASHIPSPLNIGLENSRRFRALPVYAALMSEGIGGYSEIMARMVRLARRIAHIVSESDDYILLPDGVGYMETTHICVLFRAKDDHLNETLVKTINDTRMWYVSGTKWKGQSACRVAIGNWKVNIDEDAALVKHSLADIADKYRKGSM
ncbi:pyridoxal-dependent decarboxylase [Xylariaceae sp. FL0016]|nr:pyridoxal-dependent decarboxylase [Xylariaceae sp. FL0016]